MNKGGGETQTLMPLCGPPTTLAMLASQNLMHNSFLPLLIQLAYEILRAASKPASSPSTPCGLNGIMDVKALCKLQSSLQM